MKFILRQDSHIAVMLLSKHGAILLFICPISNQ